VKIGIYPWRSERMGTSGMGQVLSVEIGPNEPKLDISIEEFDYYCALFEEMLDEIERNELDLESYLDEFDHAEIQQMRELFGLCPRQG
jgi:hypothetical protein